MKRSHMSEIAEFIRRIIIDKEDVKKVKEDVVAFRKDFQKVHFCFESAKNAYEYIRIR